MCRCDHRIGFTGRGDEGESVVREAQEVCSVSV